jgi:hypothetical protein
MTRSGTGREEGRTEALVRARDLPEGDVVEPRPGALDDGEAGLRDDLSVSGRDRERPLRSVRQSGQWSARPWIRRRTGSAWSRCSTYRVCRRIAGVIRTNRERRSREHDPVEALADLELGDQAEPGELLARATPRVAVLKVLPIPYFQRSYTAHRADA